jgi:hypothetical protein
MENPPLDREQQIAFMAGAGNRFASAVKRWLADPLYRALMSNRDVELEAFAKSEAEIAAYSEFSVEERLNAKIHRYEEMISSIISKAHVSVNAERHHLASQLQEIFSMADAMADVVLPDDTVWMASQRDQVAITE